MMHPKNQKGIFFAPFSNHRWCTHAFTLKEENTQVINTAHGEHKAFQRPFVSFLNLTIVPPRQSADKVWMDLLKPLEVEAMPCIFTVNAVLMSQVQCVRP